MRADDTEELELLRALIAGRRGAEQEGLCAVVGVQDRILVENVLSLRWSERDGTQQQLIEVLAGRGH